MAFEGIALFAIFGVLLLLRVPVAFALMFASIMLFFADERLVAWTISQRLFFGVDSFVLLAVPLFILTANIMNEARVTARLIDLTYALVGWIRGGLGMVNVGVSMIFAGVSGSSTADTAAIGAVLIPQMTRRGYSPGFSVAVTAASSVIGTIIPPSIQMIVWGALTNTSIAAMFLGGVIPGILIGLVQLGLVYGISVKHDYPKEESFSFRKLVHAILDSVLALGVPVVVIGGIIFGIVTATEAAVLSVLYSLVLGLLVFRTISLADLPRIFRNTAELACLPLFALAAASIFGYLLSYFRLPIMLAEILGDLPPFVLLPAIMLCWLVIGTFLDALPAMVLMIPIFAPLVEATGIDPVHYGVVSVMGLALGLVTPPYGLCLLLASSIANTPVIEGIKHLMPFFAGILLVIVLAIFIPELTLWLPDQLLQMTR